MCVRAHLCVYVCACVCDLAYLEIVIAPPPPTIVAKEVGPASVLTRGALTTAKTTTISTKPTIVEEAASSSPTPLVGTAKNPEVKVITRATTATIITRAPATIITH